MRRLLQKFPPWAYLPLCFCSLLGNALWFQWMYADHTYRRWTAISLALLLGWSLVLTGIAALLPRLGKRLYMGLLAAAFFTLTIVHGVYYNMFRKFFSFADMAFAGDGFAFLDSSYLVIRKLAVLLGLFCLGLMVLAILLVPGEKEKRRFRLLAGCGPLALGTLGIAAVCLVFFRGSDTMIWDMGSDPASVYENFTDTRSSLSLLGLYHYTFRDVQLTLFPGGGSLTEEEREEVEDFTARRGHESNAMSGVLAGKNLILIQLEAIDTWMVDYMPNLKAVKERSLVFSNHYTPRLHHRGHLQHRVHCQRRPPARLCRHLHQRLHPQRLPQFPGPSLPGAGVHGGVLPRQRGGGVQPGADPPEPGV